MDFTLRACLALAILGCADPGSPNRLPEAPQGTPVILVSIDTLRSDRLPAYGYRSIDTPAIDRLRADGILAARAYSHIGLTLPSHASILTGLRPFEHGVRDNLGYRLDGSVPSLPRLLHDRGFTTGGFVSAYVLRSSTGIDAGFEVYDDDVQVTSGRELGALQRPGQETLTKALSWLDSVAEQPFFLFLHLYEPHSPYEPSEPYASRYSDPYDAEVAEADAVIGSLLDRLVDLDLYDRSLIVLTSDHGEGLGDHGEQEHEILIYRETLQVPLLIKLPRSRLAGETLAAPLQLSDIAPTLYATLGIEAPESLPGQSVFAVDPQSQRDIFSESLYPRIHLGWSELVSLIRGDLHLIEGVGVELYDLATDPGETVNLAGTEDEPPELRPMRRALHGYDRTPELPSEVDPEVRRSLAALGYLSGTSSRSADNDPPRADPKSKIHLLEEIGDASKKMLAGDFRGAAREYRRLVEAEPEMVFAWEQLAKAERSAGNVDTALAAYRRAIELSRGAPRIFLSLAELYLDLGHVDEAESHARQALPFHETAHDLLAQVALRRGELEQAEEHLEEALAARGSRVEPLITQVELLVRRERYQEALEVAHRVEREFGDRSDLSVLRSLRFQMGNALTALGRVQEGRAAYEQEIALAPDQLKAYSFLAVNYVLDQKPREAIATLRRLVEQNPTAAAHAEAIRTLRALGNGAAAERLLASALSRWPQDAELVELRR